MDVKVYLFFYTVLVIFEDKMVRVTRGMWRKKELKVRVFLGVEDGDIHHVVRIERVLMRRTSFCPNTFYDKSHSLNFSTILNIYIYIYLQWRLRN